MQVPEDLLYTQEHEWLRVDGAKVRIGITDYAQEALGDVVFVQLPEVGDALTSGEMFGEVESTKSVSDLYAPMTGKITAVNNDLEDAPELVNSSPYEDGWMIIVEGEAASIDDGLLDAGAYRALLEAEN